MTDLLNLGCDFNAIVDTNSNVGHADLFSTANKETKNLDQTKDSNENFEKKLNDKEEAIDDAKDKKKSSKFKNKLEDLNEDINQILPLITGIQVPKQENPDYDLKPTLKLDLELDTSNKEANNSYNEAILVKLNESLDTKAEALVKDIANIDLNQEDAIQDILALSNKLEILNELKANTQANLKALDLNDNHASNDLEPDLNLLLETRVDDFIDGYVENKQTAVKEDSDTQLSLDSLIEDIAVIDKAENNPTNEQNQNNNSNNNQNEAFLFDKISSTHVIQTATGFKTEIIKETININKLDNFINDKITKLHPGKKENIELTLTPGDLGQVKLSISMQGDKVEIKMVFSNQDSLDSVEHKFNELQASLKAKGYEAEIKVSADNSSSNLNSNNQSQSSANNEARDEQKEKILNTTPAWVKTAKSNHKASFENTLGGILS